jgi:hypothetical protein
MLMRRISGDAQPNGFAGATRREEEAIAGRRQTTAMTVQNAPIDVFKSIGIHLDLLLTTCDGEGRK